MYFPPSWFLIYKRMAENLGTGVIAWLGNELTALIEESGVVGIWGDYLMRGLSFEF